MRVSRNQINEKYFLAKLSMFVIVIHFLMPSTLSSIAYSGCTIYLDVTAGI